MTKKEFIEGVSESKNEIKKMPVSAQRYVKTNGDKFKKADWYRDNFNMTKKEPLIKNGGPSKGIEPYKISTNTRDYRPQKKILKRAARVGI